MKAINSPFVLIQRHQNKLRELSGLNGHGASEAIVVFPLASFELSLLLVKGGCKPQGNKPKKETSEAN